MAIKQMNQIILNSWILFLLPLHDTACDKRVISVFWRSSLQLSRTKKKNRSLGEVMDYYELPYYGTIILCEIKGAR